MIKDGAKYNRKLYLFVKQGDEFQFKEKATSTILCKTRISYFVSAHNKIFRFQSLINATTIGSLNFHIAYLFPNYNN